MDARSPLIPVVFTPEAKDRRRLIVRYDDRGFTLVRRSETEIADARFGLESNHTRILNRSARRADPTPP